MNYPHLTTMQECPCGSVLIQALGVYSLARIVQDYVHCLNDKVANDLLGSIELYALRSFDPTRNAYRMHTGAGIWEISYHHEHAKRAYSTVRIYQKRTLYSLFLACPPTATLNMQIELFKPDNREVERFSNEYEYHTGDLLSLNVFKEFVQSVSARFADLAWLVEWVDKEMRRIWIYHGLWNHIHEGTIATHGWDPALVPLEGPISYDIDGNATLGPLTRSLL